MSNGRRLSGNPPNAWHTQKSHAHQQHRQDSNSSFTPRVTSPTSVTSGPVSATIPPHSSHTGTEHSSGSQSAAWAVSPRSAKGPMTSHGSPMSFAQQQALNKHANPSSLPTASNMPSDEVLRLHDRMLFLISTLLGKQVRIQLRNHTTLNGRLFSAYIQNHELELSVKAAHVATKSNDSSGTWSESFKPTVLIRASAIIMISAAAVPFSQGQQVRSTSTLQTDSDVAKSSAAQTEPKQLQPWKSEDPGSNGTTKVLSWADDADDDFAGGHYDQFAVHEQRFGRTSDQVEYSEDLYTTKINKSGKDFKARELQAEQLAQQINNTVSTNTHIATERGQKTVQDDETEEAKFSTVIRSANAYVPPGARKQATSGALQPAQVMTASAAKISTVGGETKASSSVVPAEPSQSRPSVADPAPVADSSKGRPTVVAAFEKFVGTELQRAEKKKKELEEKDRRNKLSELQKFAAKLKLDTPMPEDLVSIIAKDEKKQKEILENRRRDAEEAQARKTQQPQGSTKLMEPHKKAHGATQMTKKDSSSGIPPHLVIPPYRKKDASETQGAKDSKAAEKASNTPKLSASAVIFKPNINAATFMPGVGASKPSAPIVSANPFFGDNIPPKASFSIKDFFNPFKHSRVIEAPLANHVWPFSGPSFRNTAIHVSLTSGLTNDSISQMSMLSPIPFDGRPLMSPGLPMPAGAVSPGLPMKDGMMVMPNGLSGEMMPFAPGAFLSNFQSNGINPGMMNYANPALSFGPGSMFLGQTGMMPAMPTIYPGLPAGTYGAGYDGHGRTLPELTPARASSQDGSAQGENVKAT